MPTCTSVSSNLSIVTLRQCASRESQLSRYQTQANYLISLIKQDNYEAIKGRRAVREFQFSSLVFRKYLDNADCQQHEFPVFESIFAECVSKMERDLAGM